MIDLETFILDNKDTIFRISRYKKIFTPHEEEKKYIDESIYEDSYFGKITKAIEVKDDVLLEIELVYEEDDGEIKSLGITYYELLKNIHISTSDKNNQN